MRKSKVNVPEAARLYNGGGWTYQRLADKYGVNRERIRQTLQGLVQAQAEGRCRRCKSSFCARTSSCAVYCRECRRFFANYKECPCGRWCSRKSKRCRECNGVSQRTFDRGFAAALYREGYGIPDIAAYLGVKNVTITAALRCLGVRRRPATTRLKTARAAIERMPIAKAAKRLKRSQRQEI